MKPDRKDRPGPAFSFEFFFPCFPLPCLATSPRLPLCTLSNSINFAAIRIIV
jgi:hypothetical protein